MENRYSDDDIESPPPFSKEYDHYNPNREDDQCYYDDPDESDYYKLPCMDDDFLLNFLLRKYSIDKCKLIKMLEKSEINNQKTKIINMFYREHAGIKRKSVNYQWPRFEKWTKICTPDFSFHKCDLEKYIENNKYADKC